VGDFTFVTGARHFAVPAARKNSRDAAPGAAPAQAAGTFSPARRRLGILQLLHRPASTARRRTKSTQVIKFSGQITVADHWNSENKVIPPIIQISCFEICFDT